MTRTEYYKLPEWNQLRRIKLAEDCECVMCKAFNRITPATTVHHILKFDKQPEEMQYKLFTDKENLISVCKDCHIDIHRRPDLVHPIAKQYLYDMKNYLCAKYFQKGEIVVWTEDKY